MPRPTPPPDPSRRWPAWMRLHGWLLVATMVGLAVTLLTPDDWRWSLRALAGWNVGVALYLATMGARLAVRGTPDHIRARAADLDEAGVGILPLSVLAAIASLGAVFAEAAASRSGSFGEIGLTVATTLLSWAFVQTLFALHYAHAFYAESDGRDAGGLRFPGTEAPDGLDFLHFAMVIGVAAQTADIEIADRRLRRVATLHSLVAFFFNTVVVALAVNAAVSLLN